MNIKVFSKLLIVLAISLPIVSCNQGKGKEKYSSVNETQQSGNSKEIGNTQPNQANEIDQVSDNGERYEIPALREKSGEIILHRRGYTVSYNPKTLIPNWVAWHLSASHTDGPYKRGGIQFHEDDDIPEPRVNTYDYIQSGYDRGHMCPAGDNKWDKEAMEQSFLMTNICPQAHSLNVGSWNSIEQHCRKWANQYGDLYIVCGPILYRQTHKTIGQHKVTVPEAFFKVIMRLGKNPQAVGVIFRNDDSRHEWGDYVNSVDQVERITGYDFFPALPDNIENKIEAKADFDQWPR